MVRAPNRHQDRHGEPARQPLRGRHRTGRAQGGAGVRPRSTSPASRSGGSTERWAPRSPHRIGRHVHHKARPDDTTPPPAPTGIDYPHLIQVQHTTELADRVRYSQLPDRHAPHQPTGTGTGEETALDRSRHLCRWWASLHLRLTCAPRLIVACSCSRSYTVLGPATIFA